MEARENKFQIHKNCENTGKILEISLALLRNFLWCYYG